MPRLPVVCMIGIFLVFGLAVGLVTGAAANSDVSTVPANETATNTTVSDNGTNTSIADEPLGRVNGIWYNESLNVTTNDGLTDEELSLVVSRSMARVEHLRGLKFQSMVNITVISRETHRASTRNETVNSGFRHWNNQVWKALFIVGDDEDIVEEFGTIRSESVSGYYRIGTGNITIVTDDPDAISINTETLAHELLHALQDQHFNLSSDQFQGAVQDEQLGYQGLIEGDSEYIRSLYMSKCRFEWDCLSSDGASSSNAASPELNLGIWGVLYHPYSDGPAYVHDIVNTDGWNAVNYRYISPPTTSRELIHRERFFKTGMEFNDTSSSSWSRYRDYGVEGMDSVGEASVYMMFWYQSTEYGAGVIEPNQFVTDPNPYSSYNYESEPSSGLVDDLVVPYTNFETGETGYVWVLEWETEDDVTEFVWEYFRILRAHDATVHETGTWSIPDGGFGGAYRVSQNGTTVTIVHAPSIPALDEIRPLPARNTPNETMEVGELPPPEIYSYSPRTTPEVEQPGLGMKVGLGVVVFVTLLFLSRRSR